jgi:hydroxyacylglutathione hydrolase
MENSSWFEVREIAEKVWIIHDKWVNTYLIEGDEKSLLVDTGWGIGNLSGLVSSLKSLPLTVINTHGHPDHVCGNYQFDSVYIHADDVSMMEHNFTSEVKGHMLKRFMNMNLPEGFSGESWINAGMPDYTPLKSPMSFDLGGRTIDVIEIPGHTPGSICLYEHKEKLLFSGDSVSEGTLLLHLEGGLPLRIFLKGVDRLVGMNDRIAYIMPSHGRSPIDPAVLSDLQKGLGKILSGEIKGEPHEMFLGEGLLCKFDSCGVLYREDRLLIHWNPTSNCMV